MDYLRPQRPQSVLLASPPPRKMSTPAGDRLSTILETNYRSPNATPQVDNNDKSQWRRSHASGKSWTTNGSPKSTLPRPSADTMPPGYMNEKGTNGHKQSPPDYADIKPGFVQRLRARRGGLGKLFIIIAIIFLLIIALAVGLGVGLSQRRNKAVQSTATSAAASSSGHLAFPLGQYTFITALRTVQTDCVSNAATWRCYPYSTYQDSNSTSGLSIFNWVLASTDSIFATSSTSATNTTGIAANVSISSSQDPFSITLSNQSLTYINNNNNPRYTFSFLHQKIVPPAATITTDNAAATCYYNQSLFIATLYLSNSQGVDYPGSGLANTSSIMGGYAAWPYAVEIQELANGGTDTPACYESTNGVIGQRINFTAQTSSSQCICDYNNFS